MNILQTRIEHLLTQWVGDGRERGAQVALYLNGQLVVDAAAGVADVKTGEKVECHTLFPVFSTTKGMAAGIVHRLVERGLFDYDTPIAALWPEFAAHGKGNITVRHALNHTAGMQKMPPDVKLEDFSDWDAMCRKIAASKPSYAPGQRADYHAVTFGYLVGEVACRATGRTFAPLWHEELCEPLDVEDEMFCGLPDDYAATVAFLEEPGFQPREVSAEPDGEVVPAWLFPLSGWMNTPTGRRSAVPASSGIMSARAIARFYAALLPGGVDEVELIPPSRLQTILAPQPPTQEPSEDEFSLGFAKFDGGFGHWGFGGSVGMAHPEQGWALGFTRNLFTETNPAQAIIDEVKTSFASDNMG